MKSLNDANGIDTADSLAFSYSQDREPLLLMPRPLPLVPEISLHLFPDALPSEKLEAGDFWRVMESPPYWAFCWGGGQALARCLLDNANLVVGRRVWDFGAGSGIAGVAALQAGACSVVAVDTDPMALQACLANARLNQLEAISISAVCKPSSGDVVLAADICYEEAGLLMVRDWARAGVSVVVAESRLDSARLQVSGLELMNEFSVRTFPDLDEASQFDVVCIYRVNL